MKLDEMAEPEAPSVTKPGAMHIEEERNRATPVSDWQAPYLQYLLQGELPLDKADARRLARCAKTFVLMGEKKELYHRSPSGVPQWCIPIDQG
jgi:hypothetical protein